MEENKHIGNVTIKAVIDIEPINKAIRQANLLIDTLGMAKQQIAELGRLVDEINLDPSADVIREDEQ